MHRALWLLLVLACAPERREASPSSPAAVAAPAEATPSGPTRVVYSLDDNRLLAHVIRDGDLVIPAGHPGFAKYTRFSRERGWKLNQTVDGRRVAVLERGGSLVVPLAAPATQLSIRVHSESEQRLTIGKTNHDLVAGWQTVDVPLALEKGEQVLTFSSRKPLAFAELRVGASGARAADEPAPLYGPEGFAMPPGGGVAFYLSMPPAARIEANATCELRKTFPAAGGVARVEILGTHPGCTARDLRIVVRGAAPPPPARRGKPKYVVFWIMDSLRADALRPFNPDARAEVPSWEVLARSSALFQLAYVEGNESRVSHGSLWTSLLPVRHRMYRSGQKLDPRVVTLAEAMRAAGYRTVGVSANGWIAVKHGFGQGWDQFRNHIHEGGGLRGADVLAAALEAVEPHAKAGTPWFLYIGTIDTHVSWRAKEPWMSRYDPGPYHGKYKKIATGTDIDRMGKSASKVPERDQRRIRALYDSNVSYQDMLLGELLARLDEWGIRDETMIVITADHGDELFEHGRVGHGASIVDALVRVPLLVHYPPLFPAGSVHHGVHGVDVLPTLIDAVGGAPLPDAQGESLVPLAHGVPSPYPRPAFTSQYELAHAMRLGPWKLREGADGAALYDMSTDRDERTDVGKTRPVEYRFVADPLSIFLAYQDRWQKTRWGVASNATSSLAADLEK